MPQSRLRSFVRFNRYYGGEYLSTVYFFTSVTCRSTLSLSEPNLAQQTSQRAHSTTSRFRYPIDGPQSVSSGLPVPVGEISNTKRNAAPCTTVCSRVMFLLCRVLYALLIVLSRRFETLATIAEALGSSNQT